jgi:RimJ/RimL family protein N-acetyltransferase
MVSISTDRLLLKRRRLWHVPRLVDIYRDPQTLTQGGGSSSLPTAYRRLALGCFRRRHWSMFVVGERWPIGSVGFRRWSDGRPELVYWIHPDHWAAEMATSAIGGALSLRKRRPVVSVSRTANLGSCLVLEELGFVAESNLRRHGTEQRLYVLD